MMGCREMTLNEYMNQLDIRHRAYKEYQELAAETLRLQELCRIQEQFGTNRCVELTTLLNKAEQLLKVSKEHINCMSCQEDIAAYFAWDKKHD